MVDITINLTDEREQELGKLTSEINAMLPVNQQLTPAQFLRRYVRDWLDLSFTQRKETERLRLRARYNQATPEEQAQIDAILAKYGG